MGTTVTSEKGRHSLSLTCVLFASTMCLNIILFITKSTREFIRLNRILYMHHAGQ
jgi:hypothetical protein